MERARLQQSWRRAWEALGVRHVDLALCDRLIGCYREPQRAYHTTQHLGECIATLEPVLGLADRPGEVELALWFHDAVYDVGRDDNEARSAAWARQVVEDATSAEAATRVPDLVMATRHAAPPHSADAALLVDVDLSILGAPIDRFDEYEAQVRQEYASVGDDAFRAGRGAILQGFLARPSIYGTGHFRTRLEAPARANLKRSLSRLKG